MDFKFVIGRVQSMSSGSTAFFPYIRVEGATFRCPNDAAANMLVVAADARNLDRPVAVVYDASVWGNAILFLESL